MKCFPCVLGFGQSSNTFYGISAFFKQFMLSCPVENQLTSVNFIFLYFPAKIFEFTFNLQRKIGWSPGHLYKVYKISIDGCNLIRWDHPSDSKRGEFCIYYKDHVPLFKRDDICTLDNCLMTQICLQSEKCILTCIYCSQSQSHDEFDDCCTKFDIFLSSINHEFPLCSIFMGDFNSR